MTTIEILRNSTDATLGYVDVDTRKQDRDIAIGFAITNWASAHGESVDAIDWRILRPRIRTTFATITHESAENGDYAETGWIDSEGEAMDLDDFDIEDGRTVVDLATEFLRDNGALEPSSSDFHTGVWYTNSKYDEDFQTGEIEQRSFHLVDFTPSQESQIFDRITGS